MREINSTTMGVADGAKAVMPRPVDFPDGHKCPRFRVEAVIPFQNNTGGSANLTAANLISALAIVFGNILLKFGNRLAEIVDNGLAFPRYREMCIAMSGHDFIAYIAGVATELQAIAGNVITGLANAGTQNVTVEVERIFAVQRLGEQASAKYTPGWSQMKQLILEITRGTGFAPSNWAQNGNITLTFIADTLEAKEDIWATVARLYLQDENGRISHGPSGALIAVWETTAVGASTTLTLFSLKRANDAPLHDNVKASRVVAVATYLTPPGTYNLNNLVTLIFSLPEQLREDDVPVGLGWFAEQPNNDLAPMHTVWLHIPNVTRDSAAAAAANLTSSEKPVVGLTNLETWNGGPDVHEHIAAISPFVVLRPENPDFRGTSSMLYSDDGGKVLYTPALDVAKARSRVDAAGNEKQKSVAASDAAESIARQVPGFSSPQRTVADVASLREVAERLGVHNELRA